MEAVSALTLLAGQPERDLPCPVCNSPVSAAVAETTDPYRQGQTLSFRRCAACRSVFLRNQDVHVAHDQGLDDEPFLTWYLEAGAGLEPMLQPLVALPLRAGSSILDVGCGFGFSLWFATHHLGLRGLGLERAAYGRRGARALGIEIRPEYLADDPGSITGTFDVVHASEVIEHVEDPRAFLRRIRKLCAPEGLLILTTPDADVVGPDHAAPVILEALSPGLHRFLLSSDHLSSMLTEAGFPHQHQIRNGGHLVVWASARPLPAPTWQRLERRLHEQLLDELIGSDEPVLARGAVYRRLREQVGDGRIPEAQASLRLLRDLLINQLGEDPLELSVEKRDHYLSLPHVQDRVMRWPTFLGPLLFWAGMLATHASPSDVGTRIRLFADALLVMRHDVATAPQFSYEAVWLMESARFHLVQAALQAAGRELPVLLAPDAPFADRANSEVCTLLSVLPSTTRADEPTPPEVTR